MSLGKNAPGTYLVLVRGLKGKKEKEGSEFCFKMVIKSYLQNYEQGVEHLRCPKIKFDFVKDV